MATTHPEPVNICESAALLAHSTAYKIVLITKVAICILGVCAILAIMKLEGVKWLVHANAKVIFKVHLFLAVYVPFCYAFAMGYDLVRFSETHTDPCDYTLSTTTSFGIRVIPVFGLVTQSYIMCAVSIERAVSTLCAKYYEKIRRPYFGCLLVLLAVCVSSTIIYSLLYLPVNWDTIQFVTTIRTRDNAPYYQIQLYLYMMTELITIVLFIITYYINGVMYKRLQNYAETPALGNKYQIKENRQIIVALFPCFVVHFAFNVVSTFGITVWQSFAGSYDIIDNALCIEYLSHAQMYSLIMPTLILYRLRKRRHRVIIDAHQNMEAHFAQLTTLFDKKTF